MGYKQWVCQKGSGQGSGIRGQKEKQRIEDGETEVGRQESEVRI